MMDKIDVGKIRKLILWIMLILVMATIWLGATYKACKDHGGQMTTKGCIGYKLDELPLCKTEDNKPMIQYETNFSWDYG
jgi:hypothetical protein